jgi:hypothetical protein
MGAPSPSSFRFGFLPSYLLSNFSVPARGGAPSPSRTGAPSPPFHSMDFRPMPPTLLLPAVPRCHLCRGGGGHRARLLWGHRARLPFSLTVLPAPSSCCLCNCIVASTSLAFSHPSARVPGGPTCVYTSGRAGGLCPRARPCPPPRVPLPPHPNPPPSVPPRFLL